MVVSFHSVPSHCRLNFVLCFLFLRKRGHSFKSALIWDCAQGTSVLHCHCVFKVFKIKTIHFGDDYVALGF